MFSSPDGIAAISCRYRNAPTLARASAQTRAGGNLCSMQKPNDLVELAKGFRRRG